MNVQIKKIDKLHGDLVARPSKSFAHRYLIASALSNDESVISNIDFSNKLITFNLSKLGKDLKTLAMEVICDTIWLKICKNRKLQPAFLGRPRLGYA